MGTRLMASFMCMSIQVRDIGTWHKFQVTDVRPFGFGFQRLNHKPHI